MSDNPSGSGLLDNRDSLATISKISMAVALGTIAFVVWNTSNGVQNDGKIIAFGAISGTVGIMLQMVIRVIPNASSTATRANAEIIKETLVEAGVIPDETEEEPEEDTSEEEEEEPEEEPEQDEPEEEEEEPEEEPEEDEPEEEPEPRGPREKF